MSEFGTLQELNVKPGDVVSWKGKYNYTVGISEKGNYIDVSDGCYLSSGNHFSIVSRASTHLNFGEI